MSVESTRASVRQQLSHVEQVAQRPTRVLSQETFDSARKLVRAQLEQASAPPPSYYTDRANGEFTLSFKPKSQLNDTELEQICQLANEFYFDPQKPAEEQFSRGFLGSPEVKEKRSISLTEIKHNPESPDYILLKQAGKVVAYAETCRIDNNFPERLLDSLTFFVTRRPIQGDGFFLNRVAVAPDYSRCGVFRTLLEAAQNSYHANYCLSTVHHKNSPSIESHHALGAEDVGSVSLLGNGVRGFVLDFQKYIKHGQAKPREVLYPYTDPTNDYSNISNPVSHIETLGTQHAVDFPLAIGTKLQAVADGVVKYVEDSNPDIQAGEASSSVDPEKCNSIVIESEDGTIQEYVHIAHQSSKVKVGDKVKAGQNICKSGHNGASTEPHLHFCLLEEDQSKPMGYNSIPVRFTSIQQ